MLRRLSRQIARNPPESVNSAKLGHITADCLVSYVQVALYWLRCRDALTNASRLARASYSSITYKKLTYNF